ncbi:MAG: hypothetical protein KAR73_13030 [Spirochaetales bacterium]|jgi:hypothetical protein|nr:hypothetical protein [Spirochaetales bacterium]
MLVRHVLYLINVLVRTFERAIGWVVGVMDSIRLICSRRIVVGLFFDVLEYVDRWLLVGKRYLEQVRTSLRYRLYFEAVTRPMRARYKELKKD